MAQCQQIKADGTRCRATAMEGAAWCFNHHPDHAEERRASASRAGKRGGRGRPRQNARELAEAKGHIRDVIRDVLAGRTETARGAVTAQLYNVLIRCIETERRVHETEEFAAQLAELEERLERYRKQQQPGQWGHGA